MNMLIGLARIFVLSLMVIFGIMGGLMSFVLPQRFYLRIAMIWHALVLKTLGIRLKYNVKNFDQGCLLVSNHVSWLDISTIGSKLPIIFLAKSEIRSWPILGYVISRAGTLFIKRGKGSTNAIKTISNSLKDNQSVLIFPEGKTTDGASVSRFHPRLFQSALNVETGVQPLALKYTDRRGEKSDITSFLGNETFLSSLWRIACSRGIGVEFQVFPSIYQFNDRDEISSKSEEIVKNWVLKSSN